MATGFAPRALRNDLGPRLLDRRVYFVVDSCFSGAFVESLQTPALDRVIKDQLDLDMPHRGWTALSASAKDKWAMAPRGEDYTMFTCALAHIIERGTDAAGVRFNFHDLAAEARRYLTRRWQRQAVLPQCISPMQDDGDIASLPIFVNRCAQARPTADSRTEQNEGMDEASASEGQMLGNAAAQNHSSHDRSIASGAAAPRSLIDTSWWRAMRALLFIIFTILAAVFVFLPAPVVALIIIAIVVHWIGPAADGDRPIE
jgi:hypothetical protein